MRTSCHGFKSLLLHVEAVNDALCTWKGVAADAVHTVRQVKCNLCNLVTQSTVNLPQSSQNVIGISSEHDGHQRMFPAMRGLISDYRVELSIAQRCLVYAQMRPDVLGEDTPLLGVKPLCGVFPLPIAAEMTLVLALKQISVNAEEPFKRAARNRVFVQAYLLKKPRTLSRSGYLQPLCPTLGHALTGLYFNPSASLEHGTSSCGL